MSIKALFLGSIISLIILLSGQLAYILLASYVGTASFESDFFREYKELLWFCLSMGTYAICFVLGGLFTSILTDKKKVMHAALVGFMIAMASVLTTGDWSALNYKALILVFIGLGFSALGGFIGTDSEPEAEPVLK